MFGSAKNLAIVFQQILPQMGFPIFLFFFSFVHIDETDLALFATNDSQKVIYNLWT